VRALLDLMRENKAAVQDQLAGCEELLALALKHLKILDPEAGDQELIKSVEAELANLREMLQGPGGA
jgi:hypothetical protein